MNKDDLPLELITNKQILEDIRTGVKMLLNTTGYNSPPPLSDWPKLLERDVFNPQKLLHSLLHPNS